jgi:hypothetical protein
MTIKIAPEQEIWVTSDEGETLTGYNRRYLTQLASKNLKLSDDERHIKVRKRAGQYYEIWLPDLLRYIQEIGYGPHQNKT